MLCVTEGLNVLIRFKKGKHRWKQKPDTLTCIRADGTVTWTHLHNGFVHHDLAHYVVEKTLRFENAFFGLVAKGYDISDFTTDPETQGRAEIPREALETEPIVALMQADMLEKTLQEADRRAGDDAGNGESIFRLHCADLPVVITDTDLAVMRKKLWTLLGRWRALPPGESLALRF